MAEKKRIIDEKGKLFGKINIIDLIVLALIAVVIVVLGMKLRGRASGLPAAGEGIPLKYTVLVSRVSQEVYGSVAQQVAAGGEKNTLMANGDMLTGCAVKTISSVPHREAVEKADGTIVLSEEPGYVDVIFDIEAVVTNRVTQAVGTQEVRIGKNHIVKTKSYELINGIILTCETGDAGR